MFVQFALPPSGQVVTNSLVVVNIKRNSCFRRERSLNEYLETAGVVSVK